MKNLLLLIISILILSCEEEPRWKNGDFSKEDIEWDILELDKITVNGIDIYTKESEVSKRFGKPTERYSNTSYTWEQLKQPKEERDSTLHTILEYDSIRLFHCRGIDKIVLIELINRDLKVSTPQGEFTQKTTLKDFKQLFPKSYSWRNLGLNSVMHGLREISEEDYQNGLVDVLMLHGGSPSIHDDIEVIFLRKKLAYLIIDAIDLQYDKI